MASKKAAYPWAFRARFRANAFGWKSQPAITRVREAVAEIKKVAKIDPIVAADGAVLFLERVSPALAHVGSSSGAIGSAVNRAIEELVAVIAAAPDDVKTREGWLERLYEARAADEIPYIELLGDLWGELCFTKEIASRWADREIGITRHALSPDPQMRGHYHGTIACLASLYRAERYAEIVELLEPEKFWHYKRWAVKALAAMGKKADAIRLAESSRGPWTHEGDVARLCEEILLSSGLVDDAFARYAADANRAGTYLATFRAVSKKYPTKSPEEVLERLVASTPGDDGKWFAAAKDAGLLDAAIMLAKKTPTDPRTLARAARDHVATAPAFAIEAAVAEEPRVRLVSQNAEDGLRTPASRLAVFVDEALLVRARGDRRREHPRVGVGEDAANHLGFHRDHDELLRRAVSDVPERNSTRDAEATGAPSCARIAKAFGDHVALEFCEDREGVEAEACDRVGRAVDAAVDDADFDVVLAEDARDLRPVGGAPRETIEPMDEDAVDEPIDDGFDEAKEGGSIGIGARLAFVVEALDDGDPSEVSVRGDGGETSLALQHAGSGLPIATGTGDRLARVDRAADRASGHAARECSAGIYIGTISSPAKRREGRQGTSR